MTAVFGDTSGLLASTLVHGVTAVAVWRAGFQWKSVDLNLSLEMAAGSHRTVTMHYLEREATRTSSACPQKTVVLIPGLTMDAATFLPLAAKLDLPPNYRTVLVELPAQGANRYVPSPGRAPSPLPSNAQCSATPMWPLHPRRYALGEEGRSRGIAIRRG